MLKQRFWTALGLIPLVLLVIYFANDWVLMAVLGLILTALSWEWMALIPVKDGRFKVGIILIILILSLSMKGGLDVGVRVAGVVWLGIAWALVTYPKTESNWGHPWLVGGLACFFLSLFGQSLWLLDHDRQGHALLVYWLCLVWASDIGAYFAGKSWGQHKLIPRVSPGKTIEGTWGGLALAMVVAAIGYGYFHPSQALLWFIQALGVTVMAMIGDLFISLLKRRVGVKDTGQLLPGHGGLLDRMDSLIASLPFFYGFYHGF